MKFTKMQGCGNDYIYVNGFTEQVPREEKPALAQRLSDRHFGIGGDGVIFINPSHEADFEMEMYNADGSRSQMCGNGIRCVGKYVYDKGLTDKRDLRIISGGQIKYLQLQVEESQVVRVRVNMGRPVLAPSKVPVLTGGYLPDWGTVKEAPDCLGTAAAIASPNCEKACDAPLIHAPITVGGTEYHMTCVSMGNPHAVIFTEGVGELDLEKLGPSFENHPRFPERVNTEFVEIIDRRTVFMRVWERGSGETLACGTGCCAVAVAGVLNGLTDEKITVKLLGGELEIEWDQAANIVYMTGPAVTVFEGEVQNAERHGLLK